VITVEDWAEIRHLHASEGMSIRAIAKHLSIARATVARAVAADGPPRYVRAAGPSRFDEFEPRVRELLAEFPLMPASVLAERTGWGGSRSWFRKRVAVLRVEYAPRDPADRLEYRPGDQAQCDLGFPPVKIPLGAGQFGSCSQRGCQEEARMANRGSALVSRRKLEALNVRSWLRFKR
jgi:transposase